MLRALDNHAALLSHAVVTATVDVEDIVSASERREIVKDHEEHPPIGHKHLLNLRYKVSHLPRRDAVSC